MGSQKSKAEQALEISDEILSDIEEGRIPFEQVLLKCKKLARLRDDFDALNWFRLELTGYSNRLIVAEIDDIEKEEYAKKSNRLLIKDNKDTEKQETYYYIASVSSLESEIASDTIALQNLSPPSNFTPAVRKSAYPYQTETVVEKYQDVLNSIKMQRNNIIERISTNKSLLSRIKDSVYNYVLQINLQLKFENVTESLFQETKQKVDKRLSEICPDAMKKFTAAYNRLEADNPEEWSQAMSSCRNVLKEFADSVFPAQKDKFVKKNGEELVVTHDKYKNRILAFIDKQTSGDKNKLLASRMSDLTTRIHSLNDLLSKGTHEGIVKEDVNLCVIETYFYIGSLLNYIK